MKSRKKKACKTKDTVLAELSQLEAALNKLTTFVYEFYPLVSDPNTDCGLYRKIRLTAHEIRFKIEMRINELTFQLTHNEDNTRS